MAQPITPLGTARPAWSARLGLALVLGLTLGLGSIGCAPPGAGEGPGHRQQRLALSPEQELELGRKAYREILSKSNTKKEIARKLGEYFASGTQLAWIVDPRTRTVRVHTSPTESTRLDAEAGVLDGGDVLPGFRLPLADLFPGPEA